MRMRRGVDDTRDVHRLIPYVCLLLFDKLLGISGESLSPVLDSDHQVIRDHARSRRPDPKIEDRETRSVP